MDTRRDIGGPERSALANSADGYGKRPIKFHSLPSRQMTSDKYAWPPLVTLATDKGNPVAKKGPPFIVVYR